MLNLKCFINRRRFYFYSVFILIFSVTLLGCLGTTVQNQLAISPVISNSSPSPQTTASPLVNNGKLTLSTINFSQNTLSITGTNLARVVHIQVTGPGGVSVLCPVTSRSDTSVTATFIKGFQMVLGNIYSLVVATADAGTAAQVTFTLPSNSITNSMLVNSYVQKDPTTGYVGIGQTTPAALLDIDSTSGGSTNGIKMTAGSYQPITFYPSTIGGAVLDFGDGTGKTFAITENAGTKTLATFVDSGYLQMGTLATPTSIGIGTSGAPTALFTISSTAGWATNGIQLGAGAASPVRLYPAAAGGGSLDFGDGTGKFFKITGNVGARTLATFADNGGLTLGTAVGAGTSTNLIVNGTSTFNAAATFTSTVSFNNSSSFPSGLSVPASPTPNGITFMPGDGVGVAGYVDFGTGASTLQWDITTNNKARSIATFFQTGALQLGNSTAGNTTDLLVYGSGLGAGGSCSFGPAAAGAATCTSDGRLKKITGSVENALEKLKQIHGVYFKWKHPASKGEGVHLGVIAQDVQKVFPEFVVEDKTTHHYLQLDYAGLVVPIIEAVKELDSKVISLENRLKEKDQELLELRLRMDRLEKH